MSKGTRSLRRTATYRGRTTTATARTLGLINRTPAGTADAVSAPSQEAFRKHVLAGICPFCGLGPYKILATHTNRAHATDRKELRELAGLYYHSSITSPEMHQMRADIARRSVLEGKALTPEMRARQSDTRRTLSPAARTLQAEKARKAHRDDPDMARRNSLAGHAAEAERLAPAYRQVVDVYEAVIAERGMAYGAVAETARRLGWPTPRTLRRIEAAWRQGLGNHDRTVRGTEERRICRVCDQAYVVTRSSGWKRKTCSEACGHQLIGDALRKPPRTGTCMICGEGFVYQRQGTKPRTLCDSAACRSELSRRTRHEHPLGLESRRKISEARRGQARPDNQPAGS